MDSKANQMLAKLRKIKYDAEQELREKEGYEKVEISNITFYGEVKLVNKLTKQEEIVELYAGRIIDPDLDELRTIILIDGRPVDFLKLKETYENIGQIVDILSNTKELQHREDADGDVDIKIYDLSKLEEQEKAEQDEIKETVDTGSEDEKEQIKMKPSVRAYIQEIDVDGVMIDDVRTFREAYNIPKEVKKIAFKYPVTDAQKKVSDDLSFDMLDENGNSIEETSDGIRREDLFKVDDSTGDNPIQDNVIHENIDADRTVDNDSNSTLKRFIAVNSHPDIKLNYISVRQKELGDHAEIYAEGKSQYSNDVVGRQLDTTVTPIYTDNTLNKVFRNIHGKYNINNIRDEASMYLQDGKEGSIPHEAADGERNPIPLENGFIPETQITWDQLAKSIGKTREETYELFCSTKLRYKDSDVLTVITRIMEERKKEQEAERSEEVQQGAEKTTDNTPYKAREGLWDTAKHGG